MSEIIPKIRFTIFVTASATLELCDNIPIYNSFDSAKVHISRLVAERFLI